MQEWEWEIEFILAAANTNGLQIHGDGTTITDLKSVAVRTDRVFAP